MPRFFAWLVLGLAAGFLVVASVGFGASTVASLAFAISIGTLIVSGGIGYSCRHHAVSAITALLAAVVSAWTIAASVIFSSATAQTLAFAGALAIAALSLVGLTANEVSVERAAHAGSESRDMAESPLAAAA
jgi:hypothetical protein